MIEKELKGGGVLKGMVRRKTKDFCTLLVSGDDYKAIAESTEGKFVNSLTKNGDVYFHFATLEEGDANGVVWKRSLKHMRGVANSDPRAWGLDEFHESYPQILRASKIIYVKKTKERLRGNSIVDICLERDSGVRSLISFDSSMNFLPVKVASIRDKTVFYQITKISYEEKKPGFWFPSFAAVKASTPTAKFDKLEDLEKEDKNLLFASSSSLVEFKLHDCDELGKKVTPASFPAGTEVRDSVSNSTYIIGEEALDKIQVVGQASMRSMVLWFAILAGGIGIFLAVVYVLARRIFKRRP